MKQVDCKIVTLCLYNGIIIRGFISYYILKCKMILIVNYDYFPYDISIDTEKRPKL